MVRSKTTDLKINFGNITGFRVEVHLSDSGCNWLFNSYTEARTMEKPILPWPDIHVVTGNIKMSKILNLEVFMSRKEKSIIKTNKF